MPMRPKLISRAALVGLALAVQPMPAARAADFISGTYSSESGCQAAARKEATGEFLYLTAKGITGDEFSCDFLSVTARSSDKPGWVAVALCEEPTLSYPQLISIVPREDGRLEVAASQIADIDVAGNYQHCEGSVQ
jgi:hypothetical protein